MTALLEDIILFRKTFINVTENFAKRESEAENGTDYRRGNYL